MIDVVVLGAHLSGMVLNHELTDRHAVLRGATTTAPEYRLFALDTVPPKPGLLRVTDDTGVAIACEVWSMDAAAFGSFVDGVPPPLAIGNVELADGRWVNGFLVEPYALEGARDVSPHGGWRAWTATRD